ncbi:proton-translocating transhydrogenase family protein [Methylobrevis pamukkalensis]|uniref:proton-translocating NAD(P)(+) transhydrogenase n=1 Tax=Methylobrevis pamukkalensis TaxID=1439726 RepID=A0A1E3GR95_9HYPH|nr:proton-translocating transhydrogenase family protein [Methylobrevis pamukkalensis]ODN65931.1 NAD(P) transhydrogenase subunit alpha [Methylobrevis pamukkalensis]
MATLSPEEALERARAAAEAAREAADAAAEAARTAAGYADQITAGHDGAFADGLGAAAHALSGGAIDPFVFRLSIFVLAIFVGYYVVWSVTPALHTPLMSVTNAISSVIIVGALLSVGVDLASSDGAIMARGFGFVGVVLAAVNIFGGFLVTSRMLAMYKKKG